MKHKTSWIWYASGKHPAAKDFLEIGPRDPLLQAFAGWVAGGFRQWSTKNNPETSQNSWRFWTKATQKQHLICGLSRDSCDSFGRSFPLVVVGSGPLRKWQAHWELLPLVLDKTWQQVEYLASKRLPGFKYLEDEIRMLPFPTDNWSDLNFDDRQNAEHNADSDNSGILETPLQSMIFDRPDPLVEILPLINGFQDDYPRQLSLLHATLKKRSRQPPNAVFMGGNPEKSCLVLFKRPLRPEDFNMLWSSCVKVTSA